VTGLAALLAGTDLAGAGDAGFGADFTTGAATGLAAGLDATGLLAVLLAFTVVAGACLTAVFFAGAGLDADLAAAGVTVFLAAVLLAAVFLTGALLTGLPAARLAGVATGLATVDFLATTFLATVFLATTVLAAGFLATAFLTALAGDLLAAFLTGAVLAAGCLDAGLPAGLAAGFLATDLAANFFTTGLAVLLAALTAFFAVFLAATKRSSLDSPGPGKAGLYSLPDQQQQPHRLLRSAPESQGVRPVHLAGGPTCAVRYLTRRHRRGGPSRA